MLFMLLLRLYFLLFSYRRGERILFFSLYGFFSVVEMPEFFYCKLQNVFQTPGTIRELWSGALNLTLKIRQVTESGAYQ